MKNNAFKLALVGMIALAGVVAMPKLTHAYVSINSYANFRNPNYVNTTMTGEVYDVYANGGGIYNTTWISPAYGQGYGYQPSSYYGNTGYANSYNYGLNYSEPSYNTNAYGFNSYAPSYSGYGGYNTGYGSSYGTGYSNYGSSLYAGSSYGYGSYY